MTVPLLGGRHRTLSTELSTQVLPRAFVSFAVGVLGGTLGELLRLSPLSLRSTVVTATFWTAPLMLVTFKRDISRMLLWLLFVDATLAVYQVSIYSDVVGVNAIVRVGPVLVGGLILGAVCLTRQRSKSHLPALWIASNIPALLPLAQSAIPIADGLVFWSLSVLYPLTFYLAANVIKLECWGPDHLGRLISTAAMVACIVPLSLLPLELAQRQTGDVSTLQVGARSYATLGIVFLLAGVLLHTFGGMSGRTRVLSLIAVVALFGMSFSRGALLSAVLLLVGIFVFGRKVRTRFFLGLAAGSLALLQVVTWVYPKFLDGVSHFWLLRTNIGSNTSDKTDFDVALFLENGRDDIWQFGIAAWERSIAWGHGIGSTPYLFREATNGVLGYSGMHNLLVTVLAERGLFGALGVLLIFGRIVKPIFKSRGLSLSHSFFLFSFIVFLLFALTTGVELFLNSTREMNASLTVYLFLYVALLEVRSPARVSARISTGVSRGLKAGSRVYGHASAPERRQAPDHGHLPVEFERTN